MDYQLELILQKPVTNQKLILDCQSFINGLVKLEYIDQRWEESAFFMLSGNYCEDAMRFGLKAAETNSPYCLMIDYEQFNLSLSYDLSLCNNDAFSRQTFFYSSMTK